MKLVNIIKYTNLKVLTEKEREELKEILNNEFNKISRQIKNDFNIKVHVKLHAKGKKKKYSIHLMIDSPSRNYAASISGWDFKTVIHKAVNKIKNELENLKKRETKSKLLKIKKLKRMFSIIKRK